MSLGRHHRPRWGETVGAAAERHLRDRQRARGLVTAHGGGTLDYFALRDDKEWFFTAHSVVAYAVVGGVCLVSPDPIGPAEEHYQAWADFMEVAARGGRPGTVVGAAAEWLEVYEHSGLHPAYLGDEAIVEVQTFDLQGRSRKGLRQAVRRVERAGITAQFVDPSRAPAGLREKVLAMAGQSRRGGGEHGFSMTLSRLFDPRDTGLLLVLATDGRGEVMGFIQWLRARDLPGRQCGGAAPAGTGRCGRRGSGGPSRWPVMTPPGARRGS